MYMAGNKWAVYICNEKYIYVGCNKIPKKEKNVEKGLTKRGKRGRINKLS